MSENRKLGNKHLNPITIDVLKDIRSKIKGNEIYCQDKDYYTYDVGYLKGMFVAIKVVYEYLKD